MKTPKLTPKIIRELGLLGERIRLARLRRKYTMAQVSERSNISPLSLMDVEFGSVDISIGTYTQVLRVLGLEKDVYNIAKDDILGRKLQDISLLNDKT